MQYTLTVFQARPLDPERAERFTGLSRIAALLQFTAWARPRMALEWGFLSDPGLRTLPVQAALGGMAFVELAFKSGPGHHWEQRWRVSVIGGGLRVTAQHAFDADNPAQVTDCLQCFIGYLLDDDVRAWS